MNWTLSSRKTGALLEFLFDLCRLRSLSKISRVKFKSRVGCGKLEELSKFAHQGDRVFEGSTLQKDALMED